MKPRTPLQSTPACHVQASLPEAITVREAIDDLPRLGQDGKGQKISKFAGARQGLQCVSACPPDRETASWRTHKACARPCLGIATCPAAVAHHVTADPAEGGSLSTYARFMRELSLGNYCRAVPTTQLYHHRRRGGDIKRKKKGEGTLTSPPRRRTSACTVPSFGTHGRQLRRGAASWRGSQLLNQKNCEPAGPSVAVRVTYLL